MDNYGKDYEKFLKSETNVPRTMIDAHMQHQNLVTPHILEERQMNVTQMDVFSRLMKDRIIFLHDSVSTDSMAVIKAQLLFLDSVNQNDIKIYIDSPGGGVIAGLSLYDVMNYVKSDIETVTMGMAASMGSIIASSGTKGKRHILPHSRFMIHDIRGGAQGTYLDMQRSLDLSKELRDELFNILAQNSGQTVKYIEKNCDRDTWLKAEDAVKLGFVDTIIKR